MSDDARLLDYLLDELEQEERSELEASPELCALEVGGQLAGEAEVVRLLRSAPEAARFEAPPLGLATRIKARLREEAAAPASSWERLFASWGLRVAALAAAALLFVLASRPGEPGLVMAAAELELRVAPGETRTLDWYGMGPIELAPGTHVRLEGEAGVELLAGRLRSRVKPGAAGFHVRTPHARAEVVGTDFSVVVELNGTRVEVTEGRVRVSRADGSESEILVPGMDWESTLDEALGEWSADRLHPPAAEPVAEDEVSGPEQPVSENSEGMTATVFTVGGVPDETLVQVDGEDTGSDPEAEEAESVEEDEVPVHSGPDTIEEGF